MLLFLNTHTVYRYVLAVRLGLTTLRQVLPRDVAHKLMINWYTTINAPGGDNSLSEWTQFCRCILTTIGYEVDQNLLAYMVRFNTMG